MGEKFNTVATEVTYWRNFSFDGETYDLSHLNAHWVQCLDDRDAERPAIYRFIVTYGLHCFTKEAIDLTEEVSKRLMYIDPRESRHFNFERYALSKNLPDIISALGKPTSLVFHAGYGNFATVKVLDSKGNEINYFVVFKVFRESKKLRLHIVSAYPREEMGRVKKVSFLTIANNLLKGKKLPTP
jgi:hypothetical protein